MFLHVTMDGGASILLNMNSIRAIRPTPDGNKCHIEVDLGEGRTWSVATDAKFANVITVLQGGAGGGFVLTI
jgi:hypothetical protein